MAGFQSDEGSHTPADTALAQMSDRRNLLSPERVIVLHRDRLEAWTGRALAQRLPLSAVTTVRLSVEVAGAQTQVVCHVQTRDSEIAFGSRKAVGGEFADNAGQFKPLLVAVHQALAPRYDAVSFVEGQSLTLRLVVSGLGLTMAAGALGVIAFFLMVQQSAMLAVVGFPFLAIGGYLAWVFRPASPVAYDPAALVIRFSDPHNAA